MHEVDDPDSPYPILACGHRWRGREAWDDMMAIPKEDLDGRSGYSTGHRCRFCRAKAGVEERRLSSIDEANARLRLELSLVPSMEEGSPYG